MPSYDRNCRNLLEKIKLSPPPTIKTIKTDNVYRNYFPAIFNYSKYFDNSKIIERDTKNQGFENCPSFVDKNFYVLV